MQQLAAFLLVLLALLLPTGAEAQEGEPEVTTTTSDPMPSEEGRGETVANSATAGGVSIRAAFEGGTIPGATPADASAPSDQLGEASASEAAGNHVENRSPIRPATEDGGDAQGGADNDALSQTDGEALAIDSGATVVSGTPRDPEPDGPRSAGVDGEAESPARLAGSRSGLTRTISLSALLIGLVLLAAPSVVRPRGIEAG